MIEIPMLEVMIEMAKMEEKAAEIVFADPILDPMERAVAHVALLYQRARVDVARAELKRRML